MNIFKTVKAPRVRDFLVQLRTRFSASLLAQGLTATVALHTISAGLLLAVFFLFGERAMEGQLELRGQSIAQFLANELQFSLLVGDRAEMKRVLEASSGDQDLLFLEVLSASGERMCALGRTELLAGLPRAAATLGGFATPVRSVQADSIEIRVPVLSPNRDRLLEWEPSQGGRSVLGALRMGLSKQKQRSLFRRMLLGGVVVLVFGLAVLCGAQYWGLRRLVGPLDTLVGVTRRIGAGDLGYRAHVDRTDEVGQLAAAFNAMVERLGDSTVSKDYVDNILRSMGEALIVTDRAGRIQRVNPRATEMLGYPEAELMGVPAIDLVEEGEAPVAASAERTYRTREGHPVPVLLSAAELRNASGEPEGFVWLAQDMSQLKRIQAELMSARDIAQEANRAKSVFLANMSHELRTPLNAIIGYSQMLREDYVAPGQEQVCADLEKIERSGHLLLGIINDILDLSKIEAGRETVKPQNVDVALVLQDVCGAVQPLARQQGNVLEVDCPEHARLAYADLSKFRQSLLNLVNNACKFTENGRISVAVDTVRNAEGQWTEVHVSDTGIGIAPRDLGKLFQPFSQVDGSSTRKHSGTGLGLAISKKFCQMMGGDITVESEPGRGSRFSIRLPAGR